MSDSEIGAVFKALHKQKQAKRANNRESSATILASRGIKFEPKNEGAHLIVSFPDGTKVDFWPGTGRWRFRSIHCTGFGVFPLLKNIEEYTAIFCTNLPNKEKE